LDRVLAGPVTFILIRRRGCTCLQAYGGANCATSCTAYRCYPAYPPLRRARTRLLPPMHLNVHVRALPFVLLLLVGRTDVAAQSVLDPTGEVRIGSLVRLSVPVFSDRFVQGRVESIGPDFLNVQRRDRIWTVPVAQISLLEIGQTTSVRERIVYTLIGGAAGYAYRRGAVREDDDGRGRIGGVEVVVGLRENSSSAAEATTKGGILRTSSAWT
jgi:hypothetical protein